MKSICIAGRLTKDAELRRTQAGDAVVGFSVAVDDRSAKEKRTLFFDVSIWGNRGAAVVDYLKKGNSVTVSGDLSTREHDGRTYLTIRANDLTLQGGGDRHEAKAEAKAEANPKQKEMSYAEASGGRPSLDEDDIPFAPEFR